jgi:hypothetical protein
MKLWFSPNIDKKGRVMRGTTAVLLLIGAGFGCFASPWLGLLLAVSGVFVLFEALRGWCVLRACGIRTRL